MNVQQNQLEPRIGEFTTYVPGQGWRMSDDDLYARCQSSVNQSLDRIPVQNTDRVREIAIRYWGDDAVEFEMRQKIRAIGTTIGSLACNYLQPLKQGKPINTRSLLFTFVGLVEYHAAGLLEQVNLDHLCLGCSDGVSHLAILRDRIYVPMISIAEMLVHSNAAYKTVDCMSFSDAKRHTMAGAIRTTMYHTARFVSACSQDYASHHAASRDTALAA